MRGRYRWAFLGTIACTFIIFGLALTEGALLALALPFLVFLFAGFYLSFHPTPQLSTERSISASRVHSEEEVRVKLSIKNEGPLIEELEINDSMPSCLTWVEGDTSAIGTLRSGDSLVLEYKVRGRRGLAQWHALSATIGDHLGLKRSKTKLETSGHIFVLPDFPQIYEIEVKPRKTRIYSGSVRTQTGGPGIEFYGVREYYPGDALRHLNWKATAHHDSPVTNEFEQERVADIGIILDARERTEVLANGESLFERSVGAASSLVDFFIARGNRVGLLVYGNYVDWTLPGFGKLQREKLLQSLARAELSDKAIFENLENIPTRLFPAKSQLVVVSPLVEDDVEILLALQAMYHLIVVSPNPILFERAHTRPTDSLELATRIATLKREILLGQLRQAGIRVVDWDIRLNLPIPVEQALGRHTLRQLQTVRGRT